MLEMLRPFAIPILQYRNKYGSNTERKQDLQLIRRKYQGKLIINDAIDLIEYADGLHIGQEDLRSYDEEPIAAIKKIRNSIGNKMLGLSTHNLEEILIANTLDVDYIGLGAYRPTSTKVDTSIGGDSLLEVAKKSIHPVALIGGIKLDDYFDEGIRYKVIGSGLLEL
jgi:thiamine-phosphate pyrophosphorylase